MDGAGTDFRYVRWCPPDIGPARERFNIACGHAAFAAILRRRACDIARYFPGLPRRSWVNQTLMKESLNAAGFGWTKRNSTLPDYGLGLLQLDGPWCRDPRDRLRHTHWAAFDRGFVYDVNTEQWQATTDWTVAVMQVLAREDEGCTGWSPFVALDVDRDRVASHPLSCRS